MMDLIGRIFGKSDSGNGAAAYERAMSVSEDLISRMQEASQSNDPARALMADIWAQRNNIPYITTAVETVEELNAAVYQDPEAELSPKVMQDPERD